MRYHYGFIIELWVGCAGGVGRPLAAVGRRTGQVSGRPERGWSFCAWLVALDGGREEVKHKSPATGRGEGSDGIVVVCFFGSVCWTGGREEVKETSSTIEG